MRETDVLAPAGDDLADGVVLAEESGESGSEESDKKPAEPAEEPAESEPDPTSPDSRCGREKLNIAGGVLPEDLLALPRWLVWDEKDGRKVPVAPYETGGTYGVDPHDQENWRPHEIAAKWAGHLPGHRLAFDLPREGCEHVLIDFDKARDPDTFEVCGRVVELIEQADSYVDVSTSGTGVHIIGKRRLPDGIEAIDDQFCSDCGAEIEVYDKSRFVAMTGKQIANTPAESRDIQPLIGELAEGYATKAETPEERTSEPNLDREDLEEVDGTDEIKDVFDAIKLTRPGDIRLQSTETNTRSDGTADYDPSWANSDSGTRLAELEDGTRHDGWIYRKGDHLLDALQVVALEERIITDPTDYPEGSDFWKAVDELRARGARIPEYTGGDKPTCDELELAKEPETVEEEIEQFLMEAELQD